MVDIYDSGSTSNLHSDNELYDFLAKDDNRHQWAHEQVEILSKISYVNEQKRKVLRIRKLYCLQCPTCKKFISDNVLNHKCYQDRCSSCGQFSTPMHVCNFNKCPDCQEFYSKSGEHVCVERWGFRCLECGVYTGSRKHICS